MRLLYRISFYRRIQAALLFFLIIPLLVLSTFSYLANKQANEDNVRSNMRGILGILANDLSKTANDMVYTVNQFTTPQANNVFQNLRALSSIEQFGSFDAYSRYSSLNENATLLVGKLSLANVRVFFVNQRDYPIIGTLNASDIRKLKRFEPFGHMWPEQAASGFVEWFKADTEEAGIGSLDEPYYYFLKKTIFDPIRRENLGTLFLGIPKSYFDGLFANAGDGIVSLRDQENTLIAEVDGAKLEAGDSREGWFREREPVPGTSWSLTYEIDPNRAIGELTQRFSFVLTAILLVLFLFLFISFVIAKGLNRPISKLTRIAKLYGEGNTSIRYRSSSQDEISQLGGTINDMLDNINSLIRKIETEQEEKRALELHSLFSQIQPHFLLNTLNSIKCNLAVEGDRSNSEAMDSLMGLMRAYLRVDDPHSLSDECKLLEHYVTIMRMRNRIDVAFEVDLPAELRHIEVPRLLLQPIVENSMVHGMTRKIENPVIRLEARAVAGGIVIRIGDNGKGMPAERLRRLNSQLERNEEIAGERGIGLFNVVRRLKLSFGETAGYSIVSGEAGNFGSEMYIPIQI